VPRQETKGLINYSNVCPRKHGKMVSKRTSKALDFTKMQGYEINGTITYSKITYCLSGQPNTMRIHELLHCELNLWQINLIRFDDHPEKCHAVKKGCISETDSVNSTCVCVCVILLQHNCISHIYTEQLHSNYSQNDSHTKQRTIGQAVLSHLGENSPVVYQDN